MSILKKAFLVASDKSSSGKSLFTIFLARYFTLQKKSVLPFKCGPDYIDTLHLKFATGNNAYNLDSILINKDELKSNFLRKLFNYDMAIVEGVMGFYDGVDYKTFSGSSYEIARLLNLPVVFILDASSSSFSIAARLKGLISLGEKINVAGVVLNNVGSKQHEKMLKNSIEYHTGVKVFGALPKLKDLKLPSRHLGVYTAFEVQSGFYDRLVDALLNYVDVNGIYENCNYYCEEQPKVYSYKPKTRRAYIAFDEAFNFYYQDNLDFLEENGFEVIGFSPLKGELPEKPDFIYFGGGYPELFADRLSKNTALKSHIKELSQKGVPMLAECGGMMFLSKAIEVSGKTHGMCGVFDVYVEMTSKRQALGYVKAEAIKNTAFFEKDESFIGHEFHYSTVKVSHEDYVFRIKKLTRSEKYLDGFAKNNTLASYAHFHFLSDNCIVKNLI